MEERKLTIPTITLDEEGNTEGALCFRIDDAEDWLRLRKYLLDNAEFDGRENLKIEKLSESQWAKVLKNGKEYEEAL